MGMIEKQLESDIAEIVKDCGYKLWHCDYLSQGKHSLLRIYIDRAEGVGLDACQYVSRQISAFLDVEDPIKSAYSLEVSSPGWPRPLFHKEHYQQFLGQSVTLKLIKPIANKRKYVGVIKAINEQGNVVLQVEEDSITVEFSNIIKAQLTD